MTVCAQGLPRRAKKRIPWNQLQPPLPAGDFAVWPERSAPRPGPGAQGSAKDFEQSRSYRLSKELQGRCEFWIPPFLGTGVYRQGVIQVWHFRVVYPLMEFTSSILVVLVCR